MIRYIQLLLITQANRLIMGTIIAGNKILEKFIPSKQLMLEVRTLIANGGALKDFAGITGLPY
jgi:hypothetical protein